MRELIYYPTLFLEQVIVLGAIVGFLVLVYRRAGPRWLRGMGWWALLVAFIWTFYTQTS